MKTTTADESGIGVIAWSVLTVLAGIGMVVAVSATLFGPRDIETWKISSLSWNLTAVFLWLRSDLREWLWLNESEPSARKEQSE